MCSENPLAFSAFLRYSQADGLGRRSGEDGPVILSQLWRPVFCGPGRGGSWSFLGSGCLAGRGWELHPDSASLRAGLRVWAHSQPVPMARQPSDSGGQGGAQAARMGAASSPVPTSVCLSSAPWWLTEPTVLPKADSGGVDHTVHLHPSPCSSVFSPGSSSSFRAGLGMQGWPTLPVGIGVNRLQGRRGP